MVVTLHHLNNSRSQTIIWLLEELGIEYKIVPHRRTPEGWAPAELEEIHPLGKAPIIVDDGKTIVETAVIIEYLVNKYGPQLGPPKGDADLALKYSYWLHFAEGSAMPTLVLTILFKMIDQKSPFFVKPLTKLITNGVNKGFISPNLRKQTSFMDAELAKNPQNWFVRDFSAADIMMSFPIIATENNCKLEQYPHLVKYLAAVRERPAYKRAIEKAGGEFKM